jgi:transposase-like protein
MPWKETLVMDERLELVRAVAEGASVAEAARQFGVVRKTAHKWLHRFDCEGAAGLADLSRMPHTSPSALGDEVIERILAARIAHPTWGRTSSSIGCCAMSRERPGPPPAPSVPCSRSAA